ncbi:ionotropic receptor 75a-like isoform X3 [Ostrinia furnacalis]|uniref:ionotropic receptor 75a-like isoform X3 n=1 Tax=Ostrinia furnacalis TaxID=93504 RepID=UPI00103F1D1A|nr:ionotropic receptor 75a-like isoform X3 [Ostrinia furnacalis]
MSSTGFIISFFLSKKISLITTFLCWNAEELHLLWRASQEQGLRARAGGAGTELPAHGLHREGGVLDLGCPHADLIINAASESRGFNYRYTWLLLHNSTFDVDVMNSILSDSAILPDAEVTFASIDKLVDVYRVKVNEPFVTTTLGVTRDSNRQEFEALWGILKTTVTRRKNLNNIYLKAATTITQPQNFKGWDDLTVKHIDTFPKLTYPLLLLCAEDLNFRLNLRQVDLYGEQMNGSFNGLAGLLQRSAVELGVTSMFMRPDRLGILHFCSETVELRGAFIFRQPPKSSVSNVFLLPFSRGVWCACGGVLAAAGALLAALATPRRLLRADPALVQITPAEAFTFAIGTICQQGFHVSPRVASVRLVMFCTLLASLFAFTSYSAKIVAILQTPSDAIRTIDDLSRSPMTLGVQETTYKRVYFAVEESSGYDIISKTFTESEKCGLKLIQAFKLPMVAVPIRKHSGYRELFAVRLRWQREVGLIERSRRIWLAARARCDAAGAGFISVRLSDVLPAVQVLLYGTLFAVVLLFIEIAVKRFTDRIKHKSKVKDLKDL